MLAVAVLFCLLDGSVAWAYARAPGANRWAALHLWLFWAFVVVFGAVGMVAREVEYEMDVFLLTHLLVFAYLAAFAGLALGLRRWFPPPGLVVVDRLLAVEDRVLALWFVPWLAFKAYLYPRYGLDAFQLLTVRQEIGAAYWEAVLNALLTLPALGGLTVFLLKASYRPRTLLNLPLAGLAVAFFTLYGVTNEVAGTRRFFAALMAWVVLAAVRREGWVPRKRHLAVAAMIAAAGLAFSEYFQRVRDNLDEARVISEGQGFGEIPGYLVPDAGAEVETWENLRVRDDPFSVLYWVTERQLAEGTRTHGALVRLALEDAVPAALHPEKSFVNHDAILVETFGLQGPDVSAVPLVSVQADFAFLAPLLTPFAYLALLYVFAWALAGAAGNHGLILSSAGAAFLTVFRVEDGLESLLITLRDFALVWVVATAAAFLLRAGRSVRA
jgi:hypothetical protein